VNDLVNNVLCCGLLLGQLPAAALLFSRLGRGPGRRPPLQPSRSSAALLGTVSVVVPTLNEAARITPCLTGLSHQGYEIREIIVVDSCSQDGTPDLVKAAQQSDPRFRLMTDEPLPPGWIGRPWALHNGFLASSEHSQWILGIDADTQPQPGLVASLVTAAEREGYDLVSLSPRFILNGLGELWLQPALLMTLVYRFGPTGAASSSPEQVMANGQCLLCRRSWLMQLAGYSSARSSFCDDVTLVRYAASQGAKVGFWDGTHVLKVRMYEGALETWREWGRSLDLKDAASRQQLWGEVLFLVAVQALPLPVTLLLLGQMGHASLPMWLCFGLNGTLSLIRIAMTGAIAPSYDYSQARPGTNWGFWLSPLADPLAVFRIILSALQTPKQWRGRQYSQTSPDGAM
jgi:dolichol-phosphate mannosyltransferase